MTKRPLILTMLVAVVFVLLGAPVSSHQPSMSAQGLFEKGETQSSTESSLQFARTNLVHAAQLAGRDDPDTAAGACLALAEIARSPEERRWLIALAIRLRPALARSLATPPGGGATADRENLRAAALLLAARSGMPTLSQWRDDQLRARIRGVAGQETLEHWRTEASRWPCQTCRNRRFVASGDRDDESAVLCPECGGDPGRLPDRSGFIERVYAEAALLGIEPRGWAESAVGPSGRPLLQPTLERLPAYLRVEPAPGVSADDAP